MNISIIGAGKMGHAISNRLTTTKHAITIYDREAEKSQEISGDMIILALPYAASRDVAERHGKQFAGKIVVDISNPVDFQTFELIPPAGSSGAEEIAKLLPRDTKVLKAFNSTLAQALIDGTANGKKTEVKIAGDDAQAKESLKKVIEESGLDAVDVGPLASARDLEKTAQENLRKVYAK
ncbi:MAG: Oxidoreductase [Candidatus Paceibacter sp.]|jgi:predicted dinucleotide-binding enzyme|nr:Oxidoreductase [Candidatus Paceibacter sp.]